MFEILPPATPAVCPDCGDTFAPTAALDELLCVECGERRISALEILLIPQFIAWTGKF